jgi:hypothetical protein
MKARWIAEIDILTGENQINAKALLEQIRQDILEQIRPLKFNESDANSVLHQRESSFERLCFSLRKNNIPSPESLSTYSFYLSVLLMREEIEAKNRQHL